MNKVNNKPYVGQTWRSLSERFIEHRKPSSKGCIKLSRAITKYGRDNFSIELLVSCKDQLSANAIENFWINTFHSIKNGYNIRAGGSGGKHSEETKKKLSLASIGKKKSKEAVEKSRLARIGMKHSKEHKEKISKSLIGNTRCLGHKASDKTKLKQSIARTGINNANATRPFCIDGVLYEYLKQASELLNIPIATIQGRLSSKNPKFSNYSYVPYIVNSKHNQ